jgi:TrmH family RNA methyltransferase
VCPLERRGAVSDLLTSPHNPRVKALVALRDRAGREAAGRILIEGGREVVRALRSGTLVETLFVADQGCRTVECADALALGRERGAEVIRLGQRAFERAAFGDRADGVLAVALPPATTLGALARRLGRDPLLAVLEGVEKPGNLGAIVRTADGAGADGVIVTGPGADPFNPNAIRASLGAVFAVPIAVSAPAEAVSWLREHGVRLVTARVDAPALYTEVDLTGSVAIALGSEAEGLSSAFDAPDALAVRMPMLGIADSLNVSVAAAVLLYEARRQRG